MDRGRHRTGFRGAGAIALALFLGVCRSASGADTAPMYTADSIVNSATQTSGALAPNSIATIYGSNLAFVTRAVTNADVRGSVLPNSLDGVTVYVGAFAASLFYISPTQINFLVPYEYTAGLVNIAVARQGVAGPSIKVQLNATAPGLFKWNGNYAIASHLDGSLTAPGSPAKSGEIIVIYAVGLGRTSPDTTSGRVAASAATIVALSQLQVTIAGTTVPSKDILYAGLAPGFAGLYQINLRMPADLPPDPEIRVAVASQISPARIQLAAQASAISIN
ncbi:MAG TPA: IPT/TIG domain-containing protein [Bryobacteraceae bacterium]|nr:IPT/TIG domain-containing protein [Bryobacteraceae bacterium]